MNEVNNPMDLRVGSENKKDGKELQLPSFMKGPVPTNNDIERMKKRSTEGSSGKKTGNKIVLTVEQFWRRIIALIVAVIVICGLSHAAVKGLVDEVRISMAANECRTTCVAPETHRTSNNEGFFYDYIDVYNNIVDKYGEDIGLYLFYITTNSKDQLDRIVYEGKRSNLDFDSYLIDHGYDSFGKWKKDMRKKFLLVQKQERIENQIEKIDDKDAMMMEQINEEGNQDNSTDNMGGIHL